MIFLFDHIFEEEKGVTKMTPVTGLRDMTSSMPYACHRQLAIQCAQKVTVQ